MSASKIASDFDLLARLWRDEPLRRVLPNGLTVVQKPEASATVASVQVWVKTGSVHEGRHLGAGLSHYLEHLLFKGTKRRAGREISTEVQAHGGGINAYTSFDRTVYHIDIPSDHVPRAVDILSDAVLHSTLPPAAVEKEKQVILREIDMGLDDPEHRLWQQLFETAFREHPMRQPIIGHREVFEAVTREELMGYYRERYVPNNMVVSVAGGYDQAATDSAIDQRFGAILRRRLAPVILPEEPPALSPRVNHLVDDVEIVRAIVAWSIPGLSDPDATALNVLALALGHGDSSILWRSLREQARLVHSIDATSWMPGDRGLFCLSFICDGEGREPALAAITRELRKVARKGFTAVQVRKAIRQLVVEEINGQKTAAGRASRLGVAEVVAGDINFSRGYFERLRRVTPAALLRVLKAYLLNGSSLTVSLSPPAKPKGRVVGSHPPVPATPTAVCEVLPNQARLLLQPDSRLPNLHLRLLALGGAAFEASGKRGSTHLMSTLLARDTVKRSAAKVATAIEAVGGHLVAFSGHNTFGLTVEILPSDIDLGLDLLEQAALHPAFARESFDIERDAQIADLRQERDDVMAIGRKELRRKFFGQHPLAIEIKGEVDHLRQLQPRDMATLHRRLMVAPNVVLSVAGDFAPDRLAPRLRNLLKKFPRRRFSPQAPLLESVANPGDFTVREPREQAVVFQGYRGPGLRSADFHVAEVADEFFSGMSSRLFERVREEKGLAYYVGSTQVLGLAAGLFYFYAGTAPGKETEVLRDIEREIKRMATGRVSRAELKRCQTRLCAARRMSLQSNAAKAMHAALNEIYDHGIHDLAEYEARIKAVTVRALGAFARQYLRRDECTQVVVRP